LPSSPLPLFPASVSARLPLFPSSLFPSRFLPLQNKLHNDLVSF
jgi:hypothetical protein